MKSWYERPKEEAYLLNPAFCCITLSASVAGYEGEGMPFPLSFIILPLALHKPTRTRLPTNTRTSLPAWLEENADARVLFYERLIALKPFTREALLFGLSHEALKLHANGTVRMIKPNSWIDKALRNLENDARESVMRARFIGKWFAAVGPAQTVMDLWGIRP